ncbi:MAG TPA: SRPBCC family protein [Dehalococcoidia bacterium]
MTRFEAKTDIKASPQQVFDYVSDMTKHGEWGAYGLEVTQTSGSGPGMGATYASTAKNFGTQREQQTVTAFDPGRRFAFQSKGALGLAEHAFDLSGSDGSTSVTKSMELVQPSFLARVMSFRIKGAQPKELAADLERIKAKLEGGSP